MSRYAIVEIHKEELKFSAGHFMIFSEKHRESMHGHDYQVSVAFHTHIQSNGMAFDCRHYKQKLQTLCKTLDYRFILPTESAFLRIQENGEQWACEIGTESFSFLKKDTILLPVCNATLEELSHWFLSELTQDVDALGTHGIDHITLKVFNGRGESGASVWAHPAKQKETRNLATTALA